MERGGYLTQTGKVEGGIDLGTNEIRNETQKSQEIRSRSHSWNMRKAGFEPWSTGPPRGQNPKGRSKWNFQPRFREDLKGEIKSVTQANSGHATWQIYF